MNSHGQFWSLDVVLAGVIFTLALGLVLSRAELWETFSHSQNSQNELQEKLLLASNALASKPYLMFTNPSPPPHNLRCSIPEWSKVEGKVENCLVDAPSGTYVFPPPTEWGLPASGYGVGISSSALPFLSQVSSVPPLNAEYVSISRTMLVFPSHPNAQQIRDCYYSTCAGTIAPVTLTVWRV